MRKRFFFYLCILLFFTYNIPSYAASVTISIIKAPDTVYQNEEFSTTFHILNKTPSSDTFSIKGRIGSSSASMNQGETFNPQSNSWLTDTSSWSDLPVITLDSNGEATGSVKLRTKSSVILGNNYLVLRVKNSTSTYDSDIKPISIIVPPSPTLSLTQDPASTPSPTLAVAPTDTPPEITISPTTAIPVSYNNIYISEVMVNTETGENEWVELYNDNDYPVELKNWYIDDIENAGSSPKNFALNISSKGYSILEITASMFNNDGDNIRLLDFNRVLKNSFEYSSSEKNKSYGRTSLTNDDFCKQEPSKGFSNNPCIQNPTGAKPATPTLTNAAPTINYISPDEKTIEENIIDKNNSSDKIDQNQGLIENNSQGEVLSAAASINRPLYYRLLFIKNLTLNCILLSLLSIISITLKLKYV